MIGPGLETIIENCHITQVDSPIICDLNNCGINNEDGFKKLIVSLKKQIEYRLFCCGFNRAEMLLILPSEKIPHEFSIGGTNIILDDSLDDTGYFLTITVEGRQIIHPPYVGTQIMSWNEFFLQSALGRRLPILCTMPWAQAKILSMPKIERDEQDIIL